MAAARNETGAADLGSGKIDGYLEKPSDMGAGSEDADAAGPGGSMRKADVADARASSRTLPKSSGLSAGVSDDNRQYSAFLDFLARSRYAVPSLSTGVGERITVHVFDSLERPVCGAHVVVRSGGKFVEQGLTWADGSYLYFPALHPDATEMRVSVEIGKLQRDTTMLRDGPRSFDLRLSGLRPVRKDLPVDLLFVMDVTGSMQPEIDQLKNAIGILEMNLGSMPGKPRLRFGLAQYRDHGDDFVVSKIPFTEDANAFSQALSRVMAGGGGDGPEDLQAALDAALHGFEWNEDGIRLAFAVTDAPPHLDYGEKFTYVDAANEARRRGIKFHTVGCGSLPLGGEIVLRQLAQASGGKFLFLTHGEHGESDGGRPGSVSHHTGDNWTSETLEKALLRLARDEIAQQMDVPPVDGGDWFEAARGGQARDSVLLDLFSKSLAQLRDFSSLPLQDSARLGIPLVATADSALRPAAAWFGQFLSMAALRDHRYRVAERGNIGEVLREQALQLSGAVDPASAQEAGKLMGSEFLLLSGLHRREGRYELFLRLVRVGTGETLSATRAQISADLGP